MKSNKRLVIWGYAVELICALSVEVVLVLCISTEKLVEFVSKTALAWATLTGLLFGVALAIWIVLFQVATTRFGDWLERRGALRVYSAAFVTAAGVYGSATALLILASYGSVLRSVIYVALFGLLLAIINTYTVIRNGMDLLHLQATFRARLREVQQRDPKSM